MVVKTIPFGDAATKDAQAGAETSQPAQQQQGINRGLAEQQGAAMPWSEQRVAEALGQTPEPPQVR